MAEKTKQEYIVEQNRAQAQSDTIRHINQRKADQAMDVSSLLKHIRHAYGVQI